MGPTHKASVSHPLPPMQVPIPEEPQRLCAHTRLLETVAPAQPEQDEALPPQQRKAKPWKQKAIELPNADYYLDMMKGGRVGNKLSPTAAAPAALPGKNG